jgi:hypothetical protein
MSEPTKPSIEQDDHMVDQRWQEYPRGTVDADGNYSDEIQFDPETAKVPSTVPGGVLEYWILKCHYKNTELDALRSQIAKMQAVVDAAETLSSAVMFHKPRITAPEVDVPLRELLAALDVYAPTTREAEGTRE